MLLWSRVHWRQLLALALLIVLPLLLLGHLAEDIHEREVFGFDAPLTLWLRSSAPAWFRQVALTFSAVGSATWMTPVSAVLLVVFWRKSRVMGRYFLISLGGAMLLNVVLKALIGRVRPQIVEWLWQEGDKSFPSGHATMAAALSLTLIALLWRTGWRWPLMIACTLYTLLMGAARVYVGVHYPTDVLGGWALGLSWSAGAAMILWSRLKAAQVHAQQPGEVVTAE